MAHHNIGPDLDPNFLTLQMEFRKDFFENLNFEEKKSADNIKACKITQHAMSSVESNPPFIIHYFIILCVYFLQSSTPFRDDGGEVGSF